MYVVPGLTNTITPLNPTVCSSGSGTTVTLTANPTGGAPPYSYSWSTSETTQSIIVGAGTYTVSVTDISTCPPVTATVTVTSVTTPSAPTAGSNSPLCVGQTLNLTASNEPGATFEWIGPNGFTSSTQNPSVAGVTLAEAGDYSVNATISNCKSPDGTTTVVINAIPTADANIDQTVCANNSVVSLNGTVTNATGSIWSSSGTGIFANPNSLNTTYAPSAADITAGTVTITLTSTGSGACAAATDQLVITITPAPTADAGVDQTACSDVNLNGSITIATGGTWTTSGTGSFGDANLLSTIYYPSAADQAAGTVTLTLTTTGNGTCIAVSDNMIITFNAWIFVNAGIDQTVCAYDAVVTLNGSVTGATTTGT